MIIDIYVVYVMKGLDIDILFFYLGIKVKLIFCFVDICIDFDSNYLVVDFYDDIVYFLDLKGNFLWIFMFVEDGLCGIRCIDMDIKKYLYIGCKDGMVYIMNY